MKILIIEDESELAAALSEILELDGHTVTIAADGGAGLRLIQAHPDVVFCDIGLPGINGFDLLQIVRQQTHLCDIPFVFLTGRIDHESRRQGMRLGADDYLIKPFTPTDILETVATITRRQNALRQTVAELLANHRSEIGANWNHELMTPLNGIFGALNIIE